MESNPQAKGKITLKWLIHEKLPLDFPQQICQRKASWKECKTARRCSKKKNIFSQGQNNQIISSCDTPAY